MQIEKIDIDDIEEIKELWENLRDHHKELSTFFKNHFDNFNFGQRKKQLLKKEKLVVFTALSDGEKAGYCIASYDNGQGEIDSVYIKPEYQNQGIGKKLITESINWLENFNCKNYRVYIAEGNENAIEFYRQFGFAERFTVMQKI